MISLGVHAPIRSKGGVFHVFVMTYCGVVWSSTEVGESVVSHDSALTNMMNSARSRPRQQQQGQASQVAPAATMRRGSYKRGLEESQTKGRETQQQQQRLMGGGRREQSRGATTMRRQQLEHKELSVEAMHVNASSHVVAGVPLLLRTGIVTHLVTTVRGFSLGSALILGTLLGLTLGAGTLFLFSRWLRFGGGLGFFDPSLFNQFSQLREATPEERNGSRTWTPDSSPSRAQSRTSEDGSIRSSIRATGRRTQTLSRRESALDQTTALPDTEGGAMKPSKSWRERKNERNSSKLAEERSSSPKGLEDKMANSQQQASTSDHESGPRAKKGSYKDKYARHVQPQDEEEQNPERERRTASKKAMQAKVEQQEQAYSSKNAPMKGDSLEDVAKQQASAATALQARFRGNRSRDKTSRSDKGAGGGVKEADQAGGEIAKVGQAECEVTQADQAAGEDVGRTATSSRRSGKYQPRARSKISGQTQDAGGTGSAMI